MIKANFNTYASYVTDSLYQWDLNQVLTVTGLNLGVVPEVHFSNANMERAIVRQSTMVNHVVSVGIPNSLLQDPLTIEADIGIYEGEIFKVVEKVLIPVKPKKRPSDYQIQDSDEEIYSFNQLKNALATKADNAQVANIIAHNNDTNGNTELIDVRVGYDGTTYTSAGEAVRKQISNLSEDIADLKENGTSTGTGLSSTLKSALKTYFTNIQVLIEQMAFSTEEHMGATLKINAQAIVSALESGEETEQPESGIVQTGSVLAISNGITATQTGSV